MKKIIAVIAFCLPALAGAQTPSLGPQVVPTTTSASALTTNSSAVGTGTSQAGANNAGNAQNINFNSTGGGHSQIVSTPSIQGNGFYGSVSPDGCTVAQGGGASGWLAGFSLVTSHDVEKCYALRTYERTMQWVVNLPVEPAKDSGLPSRAQGMLMASDELCLMNDRIRVAMERRGLCQNIKDVPTYDHTGWDSDARAFDRKYAQDHQQP